jgi:hypothetical protein
MPDLNVKNHEVDNYDYEWLTPPDLIESLGPFDLDPCYSEPHPWETAKYYFTIEDNGLVQDWKERFVWCNPPYGKAASEWIKKCSEHKHAIALTFARTDTRMFHEFIFSCAKAIFFFGYRLTFYDYNGCPGKANAGAPSCLVAWDDEGIERLKRLDNGKLVFL